MAEAEKARREKNYDIERVAFSRAMNLARSTRDRREARYRRAHTWLRQGKNEKGALALESLGALTPAHHRSARAWLDAARAREKSMELELALSNYTRVVRMYPESGLAEGAAQRIVLLQGRLLSVEPHIAWRQLVEENKSPLLGEALRFFYGKSLEPISVKHAILTYEALAIAHPLPKGRYTDEALLRAARLRREHADPEGALATLTVLTAQDESAAIVGSYNRPAYVQALLLSGIILRDDLGQPERARTPLADLVKRYPHSRLVDEALWAMALTHQKDSAGTCANLTQLKKQSPHSKYNRCSGLLCKTFPPVEERYRSTCEGELK